MKKIVNSFKHIQKQTLRTFFKPYFVCFSYIRSQGELGVN